MKKFVLIVTIIMLAFTTCGNDPEENVNGFYGNPGTYEIVSYDGKSNVIKVNGAKTEWEVVKYSLLEYKGKEIAIIFSADVRREGAAGDLSWHVNNEGTYPTISYLPNAGADVWHHMTGKLIVTPANDNPSIFLSTWENNTKNTVYYIANPSITIEVDSINPALTPLQSVYKDNFLIGNIINETYMTGRHFERLKHHYNVVTPENDMKPSLLAPSKKGGAYQWAAADAMVEKMLANGMQVQGHVLVWHFQTPGWMIDGTKEEAEANLKNHINTVLKHFKGKINSWDVVNEAMRDNLSPADTEGNWRNCVRSNQSDWEAPWFDKIGPEYIELAFLAAREADPDVTLYYNDYGLDNPNKAKAVRNMIADINERYINEKGGTRKLIEGIGMQGHYNRWLNVENVRCTLELFKTLGIEIAITELDISFSNTGVQGNRNDTVMSENDEIEQAKLYAKLFKLFRDYSDVIVRVSMWGIDDASSWLSAGNPCLFDWRLNAKKAFYAISDPDGFLEEYKE